MTVQTLRCSNNAYDKMLDLYGTDATLWAAVGAVMVIIHLDGEDCLRELCKAHRIDPDQE